MFDVFSQMTALIACGIAWRIWQPLGLEADQCRKALTSVVYMIFLPALVLHVLWSTPLGLESIHIALSAAIGICSALLLAWAIYRGLKTPAAITGAMLLAAAFPNATYMGLPVLEQVLGSDARSIAIKYDLFACTPLLLTVGIMLAQHYGNGPRQNPLKSLLSVPPLWAAALAVTLNLNSVAMPDWFDHWLSQLGSAVIPLMLLALGMSLRWQTGDHKLLVLTLPVIVIQLFFMPTVVYFAAHQFGLDGDQLTGTVLEAAMPAMVLGLVLCDRYGLKTHLYAITVTLTTLISLITIPMWYQWMQP